MSVPVESPRTSVLSCCIGSGVALAHSAPAARGTQAISRFVAVGSGLNEGLAKAAPGASYMTVHDSAVGPACRAGPFPASSQVPLGKRDLFQRHPRSRSASGTYLAAESCTLIQERKSLWFSAAQRQATGSC